MRFHCAWYLIRKVTGWHRNYHAPISNTGSGVLNWLLAPMKFTNTSLTLPRRLILGRLNLRKVSTKKPMSGKSIGFLFRGGSVYFLSMLSSLLTVATCSAPAKYFFSLCDARCFFLSVSQNFPQNVPLT